MTVAAQKSHHIRLTLLTILILCAASAASAATQILLARDSRPDGEFKGVVELTVTPPADNMKITLSVDGDRIADVLRSPYRVSVDFGPRVVEHRIVVTAVGTDRRRIQWQTTVN